MRCCGFLCEGEVKKKTLGKSTTQLKGRKIYLVASNVTHSTIKDVCVHIIFLCLLLVCYFEFKAPLSDFSFSVSCSFSMSHVMSVCDSSRAVSLINTRKVYDSCKPSFCAAAFLQTPLLPSLSFSV